jgi:predicted phosphodiesterase
VQIYENSCKLFPLKSRKQSGKMYNRKILRSTCRYRWVLFVLGEVMKAIRCDLPYAEVIEIYPMADLHIGDSQCDFKLIMERIEYIKNTPNAYCILNGDLMDTAIASSIGDTYGANLQPMEQLKQCVKIFEPIKDKILAVLPGNHENRTYKFDGIDITELMCAQLGIPKKYSPTTTLLFVRFGRSKASLRHRPQLYTIYATHGGGGGRKEGGKVNRLADLACIVDADVYIHSHTHLPVVFKNSFFRVSGSNSSVAPVEKLFVNTSAYLDYGGYGDRQGYKPASKTSPVIYLNGLKHEMWAKL